MIFLLLSARCNKHTMWRSSWNVGAVHCILLVCCQSSEFIESPFFPKYVVFFVVSLGAMFVSIFWFSIKGAGELNFSK